uniref:Cadherin domain-containing protein n=1 Tax=Callorhinchus milii TaxID=7868 RepID=A0A4W3GFS2_CALMI
MASSCSHVLIYIYVCRRKLISDIFSIVIFSGKISTLIPLDFESLITYKLTIQAVDINNDVLPDPKQQKTAWAEYTINMQNVNDIPPVCNPSIYEQTIYSTLTGSVPIVTISCTDKDSASLHYSIVGGNTNDRFVSIRNQVYSRNTLSYHSEGVNDQTTFELLIQVTDSEDGKQSIHLTTTATVIIHVVPWTTTFPTTTTQLTVGVCAGIHEQ